MTGGYKQGGLQPCKYIIQKANGNPVDPEAEYFTLRIDADPHARRALRAYASSVRADNPQFADDLEVWLQRLPAFAPDTVTDEQRDVAAQKQEVEIRPFTAAEMRRMVLEALAQDHLPPADQHLLRTIAELLQTPPPQEVPAEIRARAQADAEERHKMAHFLRATRHASGVPRGVVLASEESARYEDWLADLIEAALQQPPQAGTDMLLVPPPLAGKPERQMAFLVEEFTNDWIEDQGSIYLAGEIKRFAKGLAVFLTGGGADG